MGFFGRFYVFFGSGSASFRNPRLSFTGVTVTSMLDAGSYSPVGELIASYSQTLST